MRKATPEEAIKTVVTMIHLRNKEEGKPPIGDQRARQMAEQIIKATPDEPVMVVEEGDKEFYESDDE